MSRQSGAGGGAGRLPLRLFSAFLLWGLALCALQALLEQTALVRAATAWLARLLNWALPRFGVATSVDGTTLAFLGTTQEVTPNCLGLAVIATYAAAVLGTPAPWRSRARAFTLGLVAISAINVFRFLTFGALLTASVPAFRFAHVVLWGAFAPLFLLGIWGFWAVRDRRLLAAYPLRLLLRVVAVLPPLLVLWHLARDGYLILVTAAVNGVLTAVGVPVRGISLVQVDLYRYLDVAFAGGGMRIEEAAPSVTLVAFLALVSATPAPLKGRVGAAVGGVAALFALQVAGAAGLVLLGRATPYAALPLETFVDFLVLSAPVVLWLSSLGDRLSVWRAGSTSSARGSRPPGSRRRSERPARPRSADQLAENMRC